MALTGTSVVVLVPFRLPYGTVQTETTFGRATADVFTPGVLTISRLDGVPIETYRHGAWTSATVYDDATGYSMFTLQADPQEQKVTA
jgi:hypothetical protein